MPSLLNEWTMLCLVVLLASPLSSLRADDIRLNCQLSEQGNSVYSKLTDWSTTTNRVIKNYVHNDDEQELRKLTSLNTKAFNLLALVKSESEHKKTPECSDAINSYAIEIISIVTKAERFLNASSLATNMEKTRAQLLAKRKRLLELFKETQAYEKKRKHAF